MRIQSLDGDFNLAPAQINAYADPREMPKADLVIVTLKTTANDQLDSLIRPLLKPNTAILTLQNGLGNEQILADLFGKKNVLGGMAFVCINRIAPGHIVHSDHGLIRLGEFSNPTASQRRKNRPAFQLQQRTLPSARQPRLWPLGKNYLERPLQWPWRAARSDN